MLNDHSSDGILASYLLAAVHAGIQTCLYQKIRMNKPLFVPWPVNIDLKQLNSCIANISR
jgi:hypothetical protein